MRIVLAATLCLTLTGTAQARCVGSTSFQSCRDGAGNSYTIQRYGGTTFMQGTNAGTGSQWNQTSSTFGNTTITHGMANGRSWNMMQQQFPGGVQTYQGTDSFGRRFVSNCIGGRCY